MAVCAFAIKTMEHDELALHAGHTPLPSGSQKATWKRSKGIVEAKDVGTAMEHFQE